MGSGQSILEKDFFLGNEHLKSAIVSTEMEKRRAEVESKCKSYEWIPCWFVEAVSATYEYIA